MLARPSNGTYEEAAAMFVENTEWALDLKMDGRRLMVDLTSGTGPVGYNRDGARCPLPARLARMLRGVGRAPIVLDGELVDDTYWCFDLLPGDDYGDWMFRRTVLEHLVPEMSADSTLIALVPSAIDPDEKADLVAKVETDGLEGLVAKRLDSVYQPGRRSRYWVKCKRVRDADFVVTRLGVNGKSNMELAVFDDGQRVEVGECSALTGDGPRVKPGAVVTVTFLYVGANGRLVQPVTPRLRYDKAPADCTIDQLPPRKAIRHAPRT